MTTSPTPTPGTAPDAATSVPSDAHVPGAGLLAELERVSRLRSALQDRLEAVHAARWTR